MNMNKIRYFIGILIFFLLCFSSCNKEIIHGKLGKKSSNYDTAAFDYAYVEAIKQKLMGNDGDALKYLEQCIKMNPLSDGAYYQMAQILVNNSDMHNGKKYAKMALMIDEQNLWYLMMLAGIYYQEKNLDSTLIYYEKAIAYFPDRENLQLTIGNLYSENKNYERANQIFNSFDNKYGINETSTLAEIKNLMLEEKYDDALIKAELLVKQYPDEILYNGLIAEIYRGKGEREKTLEIYNQIIEKYPDNPQAQLSLCDFLIGEKSYEELFLILNTVILNNKVSRDDKISLIAKLFDKTEVINDQSDHLMLAIMVLEANYKNDDVFMLFRPDLLIKQNKLDEAAARLEEIIKERPGNYYAWEKLLLVYLQMKDYDKLLSKGEECATLFNRSFLAKILYANGAIEKEKFDVALSELKKAEILAAENTDSLLQVLTMRADVYYKMKEYKKAFDVFKEALKLNKEELTVMNNYAYYLAEQNMDLKEAEKMAKQVINKEKGNTTFLDTYGWVLYKRGKLNEAAKIMREVIHKGEEPDAVWYQHYGYILKKQKKYREAIENWKIAIKIDSTKVNLQKEIENCGK